MRLAALRITWYVQDTDSLDGNILRRRSDYFSSVFGIFDNVAGYVVGRTWVVALTTMLVCPADPANDDSGCLFTGRLWYYAITTTAISVVVSLAASSMIDFSRTTGRQVVWALLNPDTRSVPELEAALAQRDRTIAEKDTEIDQLRQEVQQLQASLAATATATATATGAVTSSTT